MQQTLKVHVAAIVVTYNRLEKLQECLACLDQQQCPLDVIVVDNASTDGTDRWFAESIFATKAHFSYVKMTDNLGGAGGFVAGMAKALQQTYDWLWLLDDDAMAQPDALSQLLATSEATEDGVAVLGCKVIGIDGTLTPMNRQALYDASRGTLYGVSEMLFNGQPFDCDGSSFVGFLVKTAVVRQVGLPREDFFIHFDDIEYSLRIRKQWRIVVVPKSVIRHKIVVMGHNGGFTPAKELWKLYYNRRNELYLSLHYTKDLRAKMFFMARRIIRLIERSFKALSLDHPWLRLRIEWQAFMDGIRGKLGKRVDPYTFVQSLK
jgi:rhamnopyranosyl-N-acetylglucosaminyl-diphospho-decaprenol beta-1,3/1,4-galactofuranosyltransferase